MRVTGKPVWQQTSGRDCLTLEDDVGNGRAVNGQRDGLTEARILHRRTGHVKDQREKLGRVAGCGENPALRGVTYLRGGEFDDVGLSKGNSVGLLGEIDAHRKFDFV